MDIDDIIVKFDVVVEYKGQKIVDRRIAQILRILKEKGSMLSASKVLGIPYSKIYDIIARIERITSRKIVETRRGGRGGGGTILTEFGEILLSLYDTAWVKLIEAGLSNYSQGLSREKGLTIAHSHDPLLSTVFLNLSKENVKINSLCLGSGFSLAMLSLELVDTACIHLYDSESKKYNVSFLEKMWLIDRVEYVGGYQRELVFVYRNNLKLKSVEDIVHGIISGELVVANRNRGSGTYIFLETLLKNYADKYSINLTQFRGSGKELYTHDDVAKIVKQGEADVGLTLKYIAERYELNHVHVAWEFYECYALKSRRNMYIDKLRETLNSSEFISILSKTPGYKPLRQLP